MYDYQLEERKTKVEGNWKVRPTRVGAGARVNACVKRCQCQYI